MNGQLGVFIQTLFIKRCYSKHSSEWWNDWGIMIWKVCERCHVL